ncbi:MAG: sulfatase [candidate division KSB1 bacterium]|nr:sulfatase [candidate division KSB1 bacterium]
MKNNRPNILLISIDSLRADHLSVYGYHRETSPHLCRLAETGRVYENAFAASNWTGSALASLLTGLYPRSHGYTHQHYYLDKGGDSIASILAEQNYQTVAFSNNLYVSERTGMDAGFQAFYYRGKPIKKGTPPVKSDLLRPFKAVIPETPKHLAKNLVDSLLPQHAVQRDDGAAATEHAFRQWLVQRQEDKPFFAYIHYQETHSPYMPPYPYRRRFFGDSWRQEAACLAFDHVGYYAGKTVFHESQVRNFADLYDGAICYLDWRLGRLFDLLRRAGLYERTVILVTADHGEMFGEHNYFWHAFCLYEPLIRVPLIVRFPDWFNSGRSMELVQTNDLVPTLLEALEIPWPHAGERQGQSFLNGSSRRAALIQVDNPERIICRWLTRNPKLSMDDFSFYCRSLDALRTSEEKLIAASDGRHEFYDLCGDPAEERNLYGTADSRIAQRQAELREWIAALRPHIASEGSQPEFDKATWEKLRALGYA